MLPRGTFSQRAKKKRTRSALSALMGLLLAFTVVVSGCSPKGVPEGFDEAMVKSQAKEVVTMLSARDYEGVAARFNETMKAALPADALKTAVDPAITRLGAFKDYKSVAAGSGENPTIGKFAVVVIVAAYDNGNATYTISIDKDGKLTGLYLK